MSITAEADKGQVTNLTLTAQERDELRLVLGTYISEMHTEIVHTDRYEFRQELKARRALLQGVLHRLVGAPTAAAG
jgi:LPS O-antigen subunit length determinant protein (WzzB/FepE family)